MDVVWIVVAVAVVALIVGVIGVMRRRSRASDGGAPARAEPERTRVRPPVEEAGPAEAEPAREPEPEPQARREAAPAVEAQRAPPEPAPTEAELRSRVESLLQDSRRMLDELKEAADGTEGPSATAVGTVEIMGEGLQEIESLAKRKQWAQAKDKGEALHAQISLMLQNVRREGSG